MRFLYNILLYLTAPIWLQYAKKRSFRNGGTLQHWHERLGRYKITPRKDRKRIWVHAVSVGEIMVITPLVKTLKQMKPDYEIVLSVTTPTGKQTAIDTLGNVVDYIFAFPLDLLEACRHTLSAVSPSVVVIAETELWLNFTAETKAYGANLVLVNGRISDKSFQEGMKFRGYYASVLKKFDKFLMQSDTDAERIIELGANPDDVAIAGNIKYDQALEGLTAKPDELRIDYKLPPDAPVIVVGSTRCPEGGEPEEEQLIIDAFKKILAKKPETRMILAPRHIERSELIEKLFRENGIQSARKTNLGLCTETIQCVILDTFGELAKVYSIADVVVVGGGFAPLGGQNIFQPVAHGKPVLFGKNMFNFKDIAAMVIKEGIGFEVSTPDELADKTLELMNNPALRAKIEQSAQALINKNAGAAQLCANTVISYLD